MTDFAAWLAARGLGDYVDVLVENEIDFDVLAELTEGNLAELGFPLGARKRLLKAIAAVDAAGRPADGPRDAERRLLTVMFCDLVGSTELSHRLDPEDLREVMRSYQDAVAGVIARYGGHVAKFPRRRCVGLLRLAASLRGPG